MTFPSGWESRLQASESLSPTVTRRRSLTLCRLIFTVCAQCFISTRGWDLINVLNQEESRNHQSLQSFCSIVSFWKLAVDWFVVTIKKKSPFTKEKKCQCQSTDFSFHAVEWELLSPCVCVSCIKPIWITTRKHFPLRLNILAVGFFSIWFQHYLLFTQVWRVMQTLESDVLDLIIILSSSPVWLSPHQLPNVRRRDAQRHISTFAISEWIVSSASPCVSLGVWLVISTACVSAGSSVLLLSDWTRTKWTQRPENTVELVFFVGIYKGSYLVLFFLILLITHFNSLILYSPSSTAIQLSLWT